MAWELIGDAANNRGNPNWKPIPHLLRHDFESLFFVAFWSVTAVPDAANREQREVLAEFAQALEKIGPAALSTAKKIFLSEPLQRNLLQASPAAKGLRRWFNGYTTVFRTAITALTDHDSELQNLDSDDLPDDITSATDPSFDFATVNGLLTRDSLKAGLAPYIPAKSLLSMRVNPASAIGGLATSTSSPAIPSGLSSVEPPDDTHGKQRSRAKKTAAPLGPAQASAQEDLTTRRRNVRKKRMTAEEAMAAEQYRNTRLRSQKPRVYH